MVVCPNCRSKQLDGAIFCLECGASLMTDAAQESTRQLGAATPQTGGLPADEWQTAPDAGQSALLLIMAHSGRRLRLDVSEELLIGRADQAKGIVPDVDLGPEGGYDAGVSRRHAILSYRDGVYSVEDLSSANGTFVNGRRVTAQVVVPLASGDELKCGTLVMRVEIV